MLCAKCGANTIVVDGVDNRSADETYRQRVCPRCGNSFHTVEFPVRMTTRFKQDWKTHHKNHKDVVEEYYTPYGIKVLLDAVYGHKTNKKQGVKNNGRK